MSGTVMVFVDAGYVYGVMRTFYGVERVDDLTIDCQRLADVLREQITAACGPDLRLRWYDATVPSRQLTNPRAIGMGGVAGVRLVEGRLVRREGQVEQKAVDTRLVVAMCTIAHQRQVDTFVVVSGEEDIVPGVEAAEDLGLQVEVWSIEATDSAPTVSRELVTIADHHRTIGVDALAEVITPVGSILQTIATAAGVRTAPAASDQQRQVLGPSARDPTSSTRCPHRSTRTCCASPRSTTSTPGAPSRSRRTSATGSGTRWTPSPPRTPKRARTEPTTLLGRSPTPHALRPGSTDPRRPLSRSTDEPLRDGRQLPLFVEFCLVQRAHHQQGHIAPEVGGADPPLLSAPQPAVIHGAP